MMDQPINLPTAIARLKLLPRALASSHPALRRGLVQCPACGAQETVDSAACLQSGWPKCCGATMRLVTA
jgi:hypothetical protein